MANTTNSFHKTLSFVWTWASILSGGFEDCQHAQDASCQGGLAAVDALRRYHAQESDVASLIIPGLDFQSPFVQMHPLGWNINKLVMNKWFGWEAWYAEPTHFYGKAGRDHDHLRGYGYRPLLTNAHAAYDNEWNGFIQHVHFDDATGLAVMLVYDPAQAHLVEISVDPNPTQRIQALLANIDLRNKEDGCLPGEDMFAHYLSMTRQRQKNHINATTDDDSSETSKRCWIPVVVYSDPNPEAFQRFLTDMIHYELPPSLLIDVSGNNATYSDPQQVGPNGMWVHSHRPDLRMTFHQHRLHVAQDGHTIVNVTTISQDMTNLPPEITNDDKFVQDIDYLRTLADQAAENNPTLGVTHEMPRLVSGNTWYCLGGECPMGNLFSDATRWYGKVDIGIINSGGIRGPGWPAGPVRVSDLWEALPYANTYCEAQMSGLSIFKLFNYSTSVSLFEAEFRGKADRLMQVSGMRLTYNTQLETSRLLRIDIWDDEMQQYQPLDRLRIYKVGTISFVCEAFVPYSAMMNEDLVVEGESRARVSPILIQEIVGQYLQQLEQPYNTSIQGRLINDTTTRTPMNWIQTAGTCPYGTFWVERYLTCIDCPNTTKLSFAESKVLLSGQSQSDTMYPGENELENGEDFALILEFKSGPSWIDVDPSMLKPFNLTSNQKLLVPFQARSTFLDPGTATGTVSFSVVDGGSFPGCVGEDLAFTVEMTVQPAPEIQKPSLASIVVGLTLAGIAICISAGFAAWVFLHRAQRIVLALQPEFLIMLCFGCSVVCSSIIPLSFEDELDSQRGRDICCMATAWLLFLGFMTMMTSLAVMTWRINTLMGNRGGANLRRRTFTRRHALVIFGLLLGPTLVLLLLWTLLDPMTWVVDHMPGDEWNQFGHCAGHGSLGKTFQGLIVALNGIVLFLAMYHAYATRNVSDEFSHSKPLGLAVFLGVQLSVVGVPIYFLIRDDNPDPQYLLQVLLTFTIGMSILLVMLVPIIQKHKTMAHAPARSTLRVSGITLPTTQVMDPSFRPECSTSQGTKQSPES